MNTTSSLYATSSGAVYDATETAETPDMHHTSAYQMYDTSDPYGISLGDIDPGGDGDDLNSQADMSVVSFDSATYASYQGLSQWELLMKIADERRMTGDNDTMSATQEASVDQSHPSNLHSDKKKLEKEQENLNFQVASLQERLKRRNILIGTIREGRHAHHPLIHFDSIVIVLSFDPIAYLRDVIELKTVSPLPHSDTITTRLPLPLLPHDQHTLSTLSLDLPMLLCYHVY